MSPNPHFSDLAIDLSHTLPKLISHVAERYGDKPFCIDETGAVMSFAGLARRVAGLGGELLASGIRAGDRVAIWAPNSGAWIVAASAIESIGAIMVPINTRFKGQEASAILMRSRAKALFTVPSFLGIDFSALLEAAAGGPTEGRRFTALHHLEQVIDLKAVSFAFDESNTIAADAFRHAAKAVTPGTIADILFTSGTTGRPKGAMHNHGQALYMVACYNEANDLQASDRAIIVNPFFHSFGYRSGWVSGLAAGMTIYPMASFDPLAVLRLIEQARITVLAGAPTMFQSLMAHPAFKTSDVSSLRSGHTGGAKTPPQIIRDGFDRLGFDIFLTSYGQTESTAMIASNRPGDAVETIQQTVGRPIQCVEVRIVDAEGRDAAEGASGELLVRGPIVMQGYFEEPEQTAATIDPDGWLHTGDIASLDADGRLRILDRLKDIVIVGGFNAYPIEIEVMLAEHPAIAEVAVIGLPDERFGEVTAACVILKPDATLSLDQLTAWARERMANFKVPRYLFVMNDFPRTPLGKIQKFLLREQVC